MIYLFEYESKTSPYIAFTAEKASDTIIRWEDNGYYVEFIKEGFYFVHDVKRTLSKNVIPF